MSSRPIRWLPRRAGIVSMMAGRLALFLQFVVVVVALHAPTWLLAWAFQGPGADERPWFDLDLILAGVLTCVSPFVGWLALVLAWAADAIRLASKSYHFMSVMDFVDAARFVDMLNVRIFMTPFAIAIAACLVMCGWFVVRQTRAGRRLWLPLLGFMFVGVGLDAINGSFHGFGMDKDQRLIDANLAGSPVWNIWRAQRQSELGAATTSPIVPALTMHALRDWHEHHPQGSSVLVLIESMGLPRDPELRQWLIAQINTPRMAQRWHVTATHEPFSGATTSGELRTLCGLKGHYSLMDEHAARGCLPNQLAALGIQSVGIHGFGLRMFDRRTWWPQIGLTPWQWPEDPASVGLPMNCNRAFPGICDVAVLSRAVDEAQRPAHLAYALTLDTHLPLTAPVARMPRELKAACVRAATPELACQLVQRLGQVLGELEQRLAMSRGTPFVAIAGDHSPPFSEAANREVFDPGEVPVILMKPEGGR